MFHRICSVAILLFATITFAQESDGGGCVGNSQAPNSQVPNAVTYWNEVADHSIVTIAGKKPELGVIDTAIVHTAIYDAVNAICNYRFTSYAIEPAVRHPALSEAAAAAAAHDVLVALYPAQRTELDQKYANYLGLFAGHDLAKANGIAVGQQTAAGILQLRANDGRNANTSWTPPAPGPMIWQPTPPAFLAASAPWVRFVTPWTLTSPSQFRVPPPPQPDSETWVRDYNETKTYGGAVSSLRTAAQADLAMFVGGSGVHPMLQWHDAWRGIADSRDLTVLEAARLFAMLSTASSDAMIACWDSKYHYAFWRPVTAIRAGGANTSLTADPGWIGFVTTPNHPEYPAAHGCFSGSVVETLKAYFGTDQLEFDMHSPASGLIQPVRHYTNLNDALTDILNARIYGGMHYRNSTQTGASLGKQVAEQMVRGYFLPARE